MYNTQLHVHMHTQKQGQIHVHINVHTLPVYSSSLQLVTMQFLLKSRKLVNNNIKLIFTIWQKCPQAMAFITDVGHLVQLPWQLLPPLKEVWSRHFCRF